MLFFAPNQLVGSTEYNRDTYAYLLLIHPDFFLGSPLAHKIRKYGYFSYSVNEALHLSDQERETMIAILNFMKNELDNRIDEFSQEVIISQVELMLSYVNRFYKRQFITRRNINNDILLKAEALLDDYLDHDHSVILGVPTVHFLSERLNVSAGYLSDMLRSLIGQSTQQHIHHKLIERAKEKLSTTQLTVNEIAYELGFEHAQSFSKLFKKKTAQTPLEFRGMFKSK